MFCFFRGLSPWLVDGCVLCPHTVFPLCACVSKFLACLHFLSSPGHWSDWINAHLNGLLSAESPLGSSPSKYIHILRSWWLEFQHVRLVEGRSPARSTPPSPTPPKFLSSSHAEHIHPHADRRQVLTHAGVRSEFQASCTYRFNPVWVRLQVRFISRQNSSPDVSLCNRAGYVLWKWNRDVGPEEASPSRTRESSKKDRIMEPKQVQNLAGQFHWT